MKLFFCIIIAVLPRSFAEVEQCPDIPPSANLDYKKWANAPWRVVYVDNKNEFAYYYDQKCITDDFNHLDGKNVSGVTNSFALTGKPVPISSTWDGLMETPGVMTFFFPDDNMPFLNDTFRIIDTDSDNYSINLSCGHNKPAYPPLRYVTVMIYFRGSGPRPPKFFRKKAKKLLLEYGIDRSFNKIDWNNCPETVQ